ncbi:MAG: protein kinase [Acidobacteriota bacterium]|jgi:serine/threonine-protein kinase
MEGDFRVDRWLVQPLLNSIIGSDQALTQLEPKVMKVLVYLADHAGEVLPKERIIQAVWQGTFVTDDVLTGAISDLRHAFQDDVRSPKYIQTIPKRGYRLIASISALKAASSRYEKLELIGKGTRGQVFRARDTELRRRVALKCVQEEKARDEAAHELLLHEATAAAALDHPFLCKIYEIGILDGKTFIVMEYLEGRTLDQILQAGRMDLKEALRVALEIAEALEAAHEAGIVHRDLKPSNIMLTNQGHIKIMGFGGANGIDSDSSTSPADLSEIPGTVPYLSPEQFRDGETGPAADISSFGLILFEMATGVHPLQSGTPLETGMSILNENTPPWSRHSNVLPLRLRHLLHKMLARDPSRRYQVMHDIRAELLELREEIESPNDHHGVAPAPVPISPVSLSKGMWPLKKWQIAVLLLVAIVATAALMRVMSGRATFDTAKTPHFHAEISVRPADYLTGWNVQDESRFALQRPSRTAMTLSPDGANLVISAATGETSRLYLRVMHGSAEARPMPGTDGGTAPFFSPDGKRVGFWVGSALKMATLTGEMPLAICNSIGGNPYGGDWTSNNTIVFARKTGGILQVSTVDGKVEEVTRLDPQKGEASHRLPHALPGGKGILFTSLASGDWGQGKWREPEIDFQGSKPGDRHMIMRNGADARYVSEGYLLFIREGALMAVPFDLAHLKTTGREAPVIADVMQAAGSCGAVSTGAAQYAVSNTGIVLYVPEGAIPQPLRPMPVTHMNLINNWLEELNTLAPAWKS